MKILMATPYIYKKEWLEFTRNRTGFGIMVNDIFESISEEVDVCLLSQVITEGHGKILKHTWKNVFGSAKLKDWAKGIKYFFDYKQSVKGRVRYFYYALNSGTIRKAIRDIKPDVVHIHGIGMHVKPFIEVCEEEDMPYIVTLHGLIGLDKTINAAEWDKKMERVFLVEAEKKGIPVTVISTGMKRRIEKHYLHHEARNITVVCNGTRIPYDEKLIALDGLNLRKEYKFNDEKIVIVIGSICERKNQKQIVKAFATGKVTKPYQLFFCGTDWTNGEVQKMIEEAGLQDRIHLLGFLPYEKIKQIMNQADLNIVASKDEGFGFSIIEAYGCGVPTVTFSDLEAVSDLYNYKAMISVEGRDDIALAEGIEEGLIRVWDKAWIKEYATNFSLENLVERYKVEYKRVLLEGNYMPLSKTCDFLAIKRKLGYKILSYIGNVTDNKNQIELVEMMSELKDKKILAVFAGREMDRGKVRRYVVEKGFTDCVILVGFCSEMDSIWEVTDFNVFFSKNDGFGLSVIEGYMRGVPSVMNEALDAFVDVDGVGMNGVNKDKEKSVQIMKIISSPYDSKQIINDSHRFSVQRMKERYLKVYQMVNEE